MRIRPQEWLDRYLQFVGRDPNSEDWPVPVALWQDGRALSSREAAPYAAFSTFTANPTATQHWVYTFTPTIPSKAITLRLCWGSARLETATALLGVRIGAATAKIASTLVFPIGDTGAGSPSVIGGVWTADEIADAALPVTLFNLFSSQGAEWMPHFAYPEYFLELGIPAGQVVELINRTADDTFDLRLGFYTLPI